MTILYSEFQFAIVAMHRFRRCGRAVFIVAATLGLALPGAAESAHAQPLEGQARCLVLGPLVISGYVAFLDTVAARDRDAAATRAASASDLIGLYERVGCPMPPLTQALECLSAALIGSQSREPISQIAQSCMREAGMPVR